MRNLKPSYIVLGGSVIIFFAVALFVYFFQWTVPTEPWQLLTISLFSAVISYVVFYFLVRFFITEKLKILYRSIRKGKFGGAQSTQVRMGDDVIQQAEIETKKWAESRNAEISRLKDQEAFRREFLGNLGHELKTPVFAIQGYILTLLEGGLEDKKVNRMFLERASKAADRMTSILEDLDQITKMEVNTIKLKPTKFNIRELVDEIFEEFEIKARKKEITLKFAKEYDKVIVFADRPKIAQVLTNLIGNSISYGKAGGTTLVRFYVMDDIVTTEVSDNGPGISDEDLPRLFERFYRVEKSRNRHEGGSGLGLAIAKHIIESHGQTINVRSTVGVGSTFTFSLDKAR